MRRFLADHFKPVLIDDAVYADQCGGKGIGVLKERDKVCKPAVNTVHKKDIKGDKPDALAFERFDHAFPGLFVRAYRF